MTMHIGTVSVVDAVADDVRRRLFGGELAGGTALTETEVAGSYDVARSTAKAAIEKLTGEGLLIRGAHKTARVPVLSTDDVRDIYNTRLRLESQALRELAAARTVPGAASAANTRVIATGNGPRLDSVEPDMQFHAALISALGSARLERMYESLIHEVRLCMAQVQGRSLIAVEQIAGEHDAILDAVAAGEATRAVELLSEHLGRARDRLADALS